MGFLGFRGQCLVERSIFLHPRPPQPHVRHINADGDGVQGVAMKASAWLLLRERAGVAFLSSPGESRPPRNSLLLKDPVCVFVKTFSITAFSFLFFLVVELLSRKA